MLFAKPRKSAGGDMRVFMYAYYFVGDFACLYILHRKGFEKSFAFFCFSQKNIFNGCFFDGFVIF